MSSVAVPTNASCVASSPRSRRNVCPSPVTLSGPPAGLRRQVVGQLGVGDRNRLALHESVVGELVAEVAVALPVAACRGLAEVADADVVHRAGEGVIAMHVDARRRGGDGAGGVPHRDRGVVGPGRGERVRSADSPSAEVVVREHHVPGLASVAVVDGDVVAGCVLLGPDDRRDRGVEAVAHRHRLIVGGIDRQLAVAAHGSEELDLGQRERAIGRLSLQPQLRIRPAVVDGERTRLRIPAELLAARLSSSIQFCRPQSPRASSSRRDRGLRAREGVLAHVTGSGCEVQTRSASRGEHQWTKFMLSSVRAPSRSCRQRR